MRILFNDDSSINLGSTRIHIYNLYDWFRELGYQASINEWQNYKDFDVVIFGKNVSKEKIILAKQVNPKILCGLVSPSDYNDDRKSIWPIFDFFIVGSIIDYDYYSQSLKNLFIFPQIEKIYSRKKKHIEKEQIIFGYHGNFEHLKSFEPHINAALEALAKERPIKLIAIYNIKELGLWKKNRPRIEIEDIQWSLDTIEEQLLKCDIGLIPGLSPISLKSRKYILKYLDWFNQVKEGYKTDYVLRYKNTTNAGRAFVFHQLGIPVVADFCPTNFHILSNPDCGYLAHYSTSWLNAFRQLASSASHRTFIADNALAEFNRLYNPLTWAKRVYQQIEKLFNEKK